MSDLLPVKPAEIVMVPVENPERGDESVPWITHSGVMRLAPDLEIVVHQLSDGNRVIPEEDFARFLAWLESA